MGIHNNENKTIEKIFNLKSCFVILLLMFGMNAWGQAVLNYDFEGSDRNLWTFVNGSATNKWCISSGTSKNGSYSLYVTKGSGGLQTGTAQDYEYDMDGTNGNPFSIVWAYIDITFPESSSDYTFSFDWKCAGESSGDYNFDYFSVFLGDPSTPTALNSGHNRLTIPTQPSGTIAFTNSKNIDRGKAFNDKTSWGDENDNFSQTLPRTIYSGTTKRLYFAWKNDGSGGSGPSAAIDNIKITYIPPLIIEQTNSYPRCGTDNVTFTASLQGGASIPTGYAYHWFVGSVSCSTEIINGQDGATISGANNCNLSYPSSNGTEIYCVLQENNSKSNKTTFEYTGGVQTYIVPCGVTSLEMEVWGAEGGYGRGNEGGANAPGGKGGFSNGTYSVTPGSTLYVVVGGKGTDAVLGNGTITITAPGGYNGGGGGTCDNDTDAGREAAGAGGGATHIAKAAPNSGNDYQLRYYNQNQSDILLVAGGGGGASYNSKGGSGGGASGGAGAGSGTIHSGGFGYGANGDGMGDNDGVAGGGGGWQGGNAYNTTSTASYAGGGSGYIGATGLTSSSTTGGVHRGNGYARITATYKEQIAVASTTIFCCPNIDAPSGNTNPTVICGSGAISVNTPSGCTAVDWYDAETGGNIIAGGTATNSISLSTPDTYTYYAEGRAANGCVSNSRTEVIANVYALPEITGVTSNYTNTCVNTGITLTATATAGSNTNTDEWQYSWSATTGGGLTQNTGSENTCIMIPSAGGTHTYNVMLTDVNGCTATNSISDIKAYSDITITRTPNATTYAPNTEITFEATPKLGSSNGTVDDCSYAWTSTLTDGIIDEDNVLVHAPSMTTYYTVTDTVKGIGCAVSRSLIVNVNYESGGAGESERCDESAVIYCSSSGSGNVGSSTKPVKLDIALQLAGSINSRTSEKPVIIRMASGTYNVDAPVNLISNVIIDGQWSANTTTGVWKKGTSLTTINRTTTSPEGGTTQPCLVAIEGSDVSNFKLQDIKVTTATAPSNSASTGYFGVSTYAVHLNGCSNYEFVRCQLMPGKASDGKKGEDGGNGTKGNDGSVGNDGSTNSSSAASGGNGGTAVGSGDRKGGSGGKGGNGGYPSHADGYDGNNGGNAATTRVVGGVTKGAGGSKGTGGSGCTSSGDSGSDGNDGADGKDGFNGNDRSGYTIVNSDYGIYFNPRQAESGENGGGGGGGAGGGGGGQGWYYGWVSGNQKPGGGAGGGGGSGGSGGEGGKGGYGGGSSFGVYHYGNNNLGTFTDCYIASGTAGTGGNGGSGGTGGSGGSGKSGGSGDSYSFRSGGDGGDGGDGGTGGTGGTGGKGANGVSCAIAVVANATSGLSNSSVTSSTSGSVPTNKISSIDYGSFSKKGCTNSQICITKTDNGTFRTSSQSQNFVYVNDLTPELASYSGNNSIMAFDEIGAYNALKVTDDNHPAADQPYIFITQARTLGGILAPDESEPTNDDAEICIGSIEAFRYSGALDKGEVCNWYLVDENGNELEHYIEIYNGTDDSPLPGYSIPTTILSADEDYYVKLVLNSNCCGLSKPMFKKIELLEAPTVIVEGDFAVCSSNDLTLTASGGTAYDWGEGISDASTYTVTSPTSAASYTVTVFAANGCSSTAKHTLSTIDESPTISNVSGETLICKETNTELTASSSLGESFVWYSNPDCSSSIGFASAYQTPNLSDNISYYVKTFKEYENEYEDVREFDAPGSYQVVIPEGTTSAKLEVWGAEGGYRESPIYAGKGGYAVGTITDFSSISSLYVCVGGAGGCNPINTETVNVGGYNGGGYRYGYPGGGGATHIATEEGLLKSFAENHGAVLVVAGGGGSDGAKNKKGMYGGGETGGSSDENWAQADYKPYCGKGGTNSDAGGGFTRSSQATTGLNGVNDDYQGGFGFGGGGITYRTGTSAFGYGGAGGAGWYGGSGTIPDNSGDDDRGGGGGSGHVKDGLSNTQLIAGNESMPTHDGTSTMVGNAGNGYAKITFYRSSTPTCQSAPTRVDITVNKPSLGTLSIDGVTEICHGASTTLTVESAGDNVGSLYYTWSDGLGSSAESGTITTANTYTVSVTATNTVSTLTCTEETNSPLLATVSYKVPTDSQLSAMGATDGCLIWTGLDSDWSTTNNWMEYRTAGGGTYTLASIPNNGSNVVIGEYDCVSGDNPTLNIDATANVGGLTIAENVTLSGDNTINIYGNMLNNGTFNAPVVFANTTELSGNGVTTFRGVTIDGSLTSGSSPITLAGNWTNNGTYTAGSGAITFAGESEQTIGGSSATAFNNVTFNNANGISVSTVPTINGEANFTNGIVSGNVTFGSSATASAINASKNSYVDGLVTKSGSANGFTFPTGDNGNLGTVKVTSAASNVSVQYFGTEAGFSDSDLPRWWNVADMCGEDQFNHISNIEYWKISSVSGFTANFTADAGSDMHFNSNPENDRDPDNVQMAFFGSNCWTNIGGSTSIDGNKITMTGVTIPENTTRDISGNYIAPASKSKSTVLPIELLSFSATCNNKSALVEWSTASERNNDYFVIERSDDAMNFSEVGRVAGAGNSIEQLDYTYNDYGIHGGDNYYRLVQVDYDGTRSVSDIVVATCIDTEVVEPDVQAYPNPFNDDLTIELDNFGNRPATIEVYDVLGKLIYTEKASAPQNSYETILNLSNLPPAAYTVRVSTNDFVINKNVVKQ